MKPSCRSCRASVVWFVLAMGTPAFAQPAGNPADHAIRQVLATQVAAWNRGDIPGFMTGYANSTRTTFIGKSIEHGYASILSRYLGRYPTRAAMGQLEFMGLDVRMLGAEHAVVTGHFHLTRGQAGGGDASGVFSLVFEKEAAGWKIILDHTS